MNEDHSWKALFQPGETEGYFDALGHRTLELGAGYDPLTAWYCAELSRLVYRQGGDEGGGRLPTRQQILHEVGLLEIAFVNKGGASAMVVGAPGGLRIVVFRGTNDFQDWLTNVNNLGVRAHFGFALALARVWPGIVDHIKDTHKAIFTGHSLGGAMAVLAAFPWAPVYTFGAPRASRGLQLDNCSRVVNHRDMVPTLPLPFEHVGELRFITRKGEMKEKPNGWTQWVDKLKRCAPVDLSHPPEHLTDHAPINYIARLERLVESG